MHAVTAPVADLVLRGHPLDAPGVVQVRGGQSLLKMLLEASGGELSPDLHVRVGGYEVPRAHWDKVRPKAGACITVVRDSLAGSGGGWKQILGAVIMIVVAIYAPYLGAAASSAAGFGSAAAWGAAITLATSLAVSALLAPPTPSGGTGSGQQTQWNQLTGTQNSYNPWGVIPFVIGDCRFFPPIAAMQYNEMVGENAFFHCMFDLGHGDLDVSEIKIGDTAIELYDDVQYEITKTPTLYTNDVFEASVGSTLENGDVVERTTAPATEAISIDLVHGQGLFGAGNTGKTYPIANAFRVSYRPVGSVTWLLPQNVRWGGLRAVPASEAGNYPTANAWVSRETKKPFSAGMAWDVPPGQYEVRVQRIAVGRSSNDQNTNVDAVTWALLRSVKYTNPSTTGTWKLCMRIRATDQLNNVLNTVSCRVKQRVSVYDRASGTWSAPQPSTNAAWCTYWLMTECPSFSRHVAPSKIDLDSFADYAEWVDARGFQARKVCDSATTAWELINNVLSGSLGSLGFRDARYSIVFDSGVQEPSWSFTPLETRNLRVSRQFVDLPHALRMQFKNPGADYQEDEIIVLDDGYSYRGVDARGNPSSLPEPTLFETMRIEQEMEPFQVWQLGRYHLGQGKYRPNTVVWESDIAGLSTTRGDMVEVAHDVTEWGVGWGRVVSITPAVNIPGAQAWLQLDETITTEAGRSFSVQLRKSDGRREVIRIIGSGGDSSGFALATMPTGLQSGDAAIVGLTGQETKRLLITRVRYRNQLDTEFTAVEYDDRLLPFYSDPPDVLTSEIFGTLYDGPDDPVVIGVVSDPANDQVDDAGIRRPQVVIGIRPPTGVATVMQ